MQIMKLNNELNELKEDFKMLKSKFNKRNEECDQMEISQNNIKHSLEIKQSECNSLTQQVKDQLNSIQKKDEIIKGLDLRILE